MSDYFDGISPSCTSEDDLNRHFGDIEEDSLNQALYYIINDVCSAGRNYKIVETPFKESDKQQKIINLLGFRGEIGSF